MAKGEFDMLYLCAGRGGYDIIFPLINQHLLRGGVRKKTPEMIRGASKKWKEKINRGIIIAHPLDKLWMLPNQIWMFLLHLQLLMF